MARRKQRLVGTDQMAPADPIAQAPLGGAEPLAMANPSTNGHAPAPNTDDDYWARALGKASLPPVAPSPAAIRHRSDTTSPRGPEVEQPEGDTAASYWDRARGAAPRRPVLPERPAAPPQRAAAVEVAPESAVPSLPMTQDTDVAPAPLMASEPAPVPTEGLAAAQPESGVRGAHARKEDPVAAAVSGSHVKTEDPLAGEAWDAHLAEDDALASQVRGAHIMADDPLAATFSPAHASKVTDPVEVFAATNGAGVTSEAVESLEPAAAQASETEAHESAAETLPSKTRRRRRGVVPVAGAAAALAAGLGAGGAYAYLTSTGSGTALATTYTPGAITATAVAAPTADVNLYPGGPGVAVDFTVNNPNPYAVTFTGWSGATLSSVTPVGANTCTTGDFQIAAASGSFGSALTIPANTPSSPGVAGTAAGVVQLQTTAQNGCQGATVTLTLTLTGGQQS